MLIGGVIARAPPEAISQKLRTFESHNVGFINFVELPAVGSPQLAANIKMYYNLMPRGLAQRLFTKKTMKRGGFIYITTNKINTVLYTGVTSDLFKRINEHKTGHHPNAFTKKYNVTKLVCFEAFSRIEEAIAREKQIKAGSRQKKIDLIEKENSEWADLFPQLVF